jgi:hypothetical protein
MLSETFFFINELIIPPLHPRIILKYEDKLSFKKKLKQWNRNRFHDLKFYFHSKSKSESKFYSFRYHD